MGKRKVDDGEPFAFAGLWDRWKDPAGRALETCSILTTTPNAITAAVHGRMPVILNPDSYDLWLDPGFADVAALSDLLNPFDARLMRCYPVSARVGNVALADHARQTAEDYLGITDGLKAEHTDLTGVTYICLRLAIRAFSGLLPRQLESSADF